MPNSSDTASMAASSVFGGMSPGTRPVFVFPANLEFYLEDQTTHKRVLTLYNPYDTEMIFKVLCNNPKKYAVVEPEGRIAAQKYRYRGKTRCSVTFVCSTNGQIPYSDF